MRVQEVASQRPEGVSEGHLRNSEAISEKSRVSNTLTTTSEGRFRLQEGNKSTMGQTASVRVPPPYSNTTRTFAASSAPSDASDKKGALSTLGHTESNTRRSMTNLGGTNLGNKNPFSDEDDYDESKNPFAEDETGTNPFGKGNDYNDSLNPFAE